MKGIIEIRPNYPIRKSGISGERFLKIKKRGVDMPYGKCDSCAERSTCPIRITQAIKIAYFMAEMDKRKQDDD
jgi:hypothetical protein